MAAFAVTAAISPAFAGADAALHPAPAAATAGPPPGEGAAPAHHPVPFAGGESLIYEISFMGIVAGQGEMTVDPPADFAGVPAYRIVSRARSTPFFSRIFKVDDFTESWVEARRFRALRFEKRLREGNKSRDELIRYDPVRNVATSGDGREVATPAMVHDALSALYYVRSVELVPGKSLQLAVCAGGKNYQLVVDVLARERISTPFGKRDAIKVEPRQQYEGVFDQRGRLWVWLSDDAERLPLLMRSSLPIGSITARLVDYRIAPASP